MANENDLFGGGNTATANSTPAMLDQPQDFTKEDIREAFEIPQDPNFKVTVPDTIKADTLTDTKTQTQFEDMTAQRDQQDADQQAGLMAAFTRKQEGRANETDLANLDYAISKGIFKEPTMPDGTKQEPMQPVADTTPTGETVPGTDITPGPGLADAQQAAPASATTKALDDIIARREEETRDTPDLLAFKQAQQEAATAVIAAKQAIEEKDFIDKLELKKLEGEVIPMSFINRQKSKYISDEDIANATLVMDYNNKQILSQIASGNFTAAEALAKDIADDVKEVDNLRIDRAEAEDAITREEADKLRAEAEEQRDLAKQGFVYVSDPANLAGLQEAEIYRDPITDRIYKLPENKSIITVGGRKKLFNELTNTIESDLGPATSGSTSTSTVSDKQIVEEDIAAIIGKDGYVNTPNYRELREQVRRDAPSLLSWFDKTFPPSEYVNPNDATAQDLLADDKDDTTKVLEEFFKDDTPGV